METEQRRAWQRRALRIALAFAGTAIYAASFGLTPESRQLAPLAIRIALASGFSWIALGAAILAVTGGRPAVVAWMDACLFTMAVGLLVLGGSVLINLLRLPAPPVAHLAVLVVSNVVMASEFVRRSVRLGMTAHRARQLWFGVLDGVFLVLLLWLPVGR